MKSPLKTGTRPADAAEVLVDGHKLSLTRGRSVAAALFEAGIVALRNSPRAGTPRGAFCLMGVCQECAIFIDGRVRQACLVPVTDGLVIELRGVP